MMAWRFILERKFLMLGPLSARPFVEWDHLIAPIQGESPVGQSLRYDTVYDQIKEARREEDERLSQGIWKTEVKKADWLVVESLCVDSLIHRSKDLQIAGWLAEAWTTLDHLKGAIQGVKLLQALCASYWHDIYPTFIETDPESMDYRLRLLEWFDTTLADRLLFIPLTFCEAREDLSGLTLAHWLEATNLEMISRRTTDGKNMLAQAEASGKITVSLYRKGLDLTSLSFLQDRVQNVKDLQQTMGEFYQFLESVLQKQAPTFTKIKTNLENISRLVDISFQQKQKKVKDPTPDDLSRVQPSIQELLQSEMGDRQEKEPTQQDSDTVTIAERQDAYRALKDIGIFLKTLDAHSPVPALLEVMVSWQDKSLVEILADVAKGTQEGHVFLRLLGNTTQTSPVK